ncbi:SAP30-binding protein-like isoform X2 [Macadamia integrifolia]|uniref:SAP30-binding protein-like isoform X2 n=1 Tax=Macadamia integrifolia TaxID=60698 RepID=UPI001C4F870E|nr:SAP30-binding protein-like isoform X2 [Macadamia integrifolia]
MASKRKGSEGIALLSMYNDEDEDMDDAGEEVDNKEDTINSDSDSAFEAIPQLLQSQASIPTEDSTPRSDRVVSLTPQKPQASLNSPLLVSRPPPSSAPLLDAQSTRKGTLAIVDYAHDETAMSPEAEEGEIVSAGCVMFGEELQTVNGDFQERTPQGIVQILTADSQTTPHPTEQLVPPQSNNSISINDSRIKSEGAGVEEANMVSTEIQRDVDPLDRFVPPPPKAKCPEQLQEKINKFLSYKRAGKSFNAEVRNRKDYRNPDFLLHAVSYQDIDQIGSCFSKEVFDPHGYDKSDYFDELEADMKREMERKGQEMKKNQRLEFVSGGTQPGILTARPKINVPNPGTASDALARDGRQNKKSKWDKVDGDRRNPLLSAGQDAVSTVGAHAALLSAANLGAGYTAFAQQRRKEAEEKRSSEKKSERRS